jgi:hypothetical protein
MPHIPDCTKVAGLACQHLAERWRHVTDQTDICERHNLELSTMIVLRWIAIGDRKAEENLKRATALLRR